MLQAWQSLVLIIRPYINMNEKKHLFFTYFLIVET